MITVKDLLEFVDRHQIPLDSEVHVVSNHSADRVNAIDVESPAVVALNLTTEGMLRIDVF